MDTLTALNTRVSVARLTEPGPSADQVRQLLAAAIRATPGAELVLEPPANQVFARITAAQERALKAAGIAFYRWPPEAGATEAGPDAPVTVRLVTSFQTGDDEAEAFAHALVGAR